MTRISKNQNVISSILDRLIDEEPEKRYESIKSRNQQLTELYQSVRRDLENLLNSRVAGLSWPKEWSELATSLINYGIKDFMSNTMLTSTSQNKFCDELTEIIQRFEPRFKSVQVKLLQSTDKQDRTLKMRIEGLLYAEPAPEPIVFDSILEPETNQFLITETTTS